jgi:hypothetical protein
MMVPRMRRGVLHAAPLIRGRSKRRVWNGPGSAKQRYTPHRARDTAFALRDASLRDAPQGEGRLMIGTHSIHAAMIFFAACVRKPDRVKPSFSA